jgi:hypothetical protein
MKINWVISATLHWRGIKEWGINFILEHNQWGTFQSIVFWGNHCSSVHEKYVIERLPTAFHVYQWLNNIDELKYSHRPVNEKIIWWHFQHVILEVKQWFIWKYFWNISPIMQNEDFLCFLTEQIYYQHILQVYSNLKMHFIFKPICLKEFFHCLFYIFVPQTVYDRI